jgi:hypothetical protein
MIGTNIQLKQTEKAILTHPVDYTTQQQGFENLTKYCWASTYNVYIRWLVPHITDNLQTLVISGQRNVQIENHCIGVCNGLFSTSPPNFEQSYHNKVNWEQIYVIISNPIHFCIPFMALFWCPKMSIFHIISKILQTWHIDSIHMGEYFHRRILKINVSNLICDKKYNF